MHVKHVNRCGTAAAEQGTGAGMSPLRGSESGGIFPVGFSFATIKALATHLHVACVGVRVHVRAMGSGYGGGVG